MASLAPVVRRGGEHAVAAAVLEDAARLAVEHAVDSRVDPVLDGRARPQLAGVRRDVRRPATSSVQGQTSDEGNGKEEGRQ